MILLIGGAGQGKLAYALEKTGCTAEDVARDPESAKQRPILAGLADWVKDHPEGTLDELLSVNPGVVILCDEVGCGVVPVCREERAWREAVGRLCCELAKKADRVERIFCGLSMTLKGEGTWS